MPSLHHLPVLRFSYLDSALEELTGKERNRFYRASKVFEIINKPIDQL